MFCFMRLVHVLLYLSFIRRLLMGWKSLNEELSVFLTTLNHNLKVKVNSDPILKLKWCLNISAFQDLQFLFAENPCGTCPRGQKRVLKIVNEKWKSQKLKKMTFPSSCEQTLGRILDLHKISDLLGQRNDVLQTLGSWRKLASMVWPLFVIIWFVFWLDGLWSMANF